MFYFTHRQEWLVTLPCNDCLGNVTFYLLLLQAKSMVGCPKGNVTSPTVLSVVHTLFKYAMTPQKSLIKSKSKYLYKAYFMFLKRINQRLII